MPSGRALICSPEFCCSQSDRIRHPGRNKRRGRILLKPNRSNPSLRLQQNHDDERRPGPDRNGTLALGDLLDNARRAAVVASTVTSRATSRVTSRPQLRARADPVRCCQVSAGSRRRALVIADWSSAIDPSTRSMNSVDSVPADWMRRVRAVRSSRRESASPTPRHTSTVVETGRSAIASRIARRLAADSDLKCSRRCPLRTRSPRARRTAAAPCASVSEAASRCRPGRTDSSR